MVTARLGPSLLALATFLGCGHAAPPEPVWPIAVEGAPRDVRPLAGEWRGEFLDQSTHRSGTILFRLHDGTGEGSVTFTTPTPALACPNPIGESTADRDRGRTVLRIARLAVDAGSVGGSLASYRDPERNCWVDTWFMGRLLGDRLEGSFFVHPSVGDTIRAGSWWAARRR